MSKTNTAAEIAAKELLSRVFELFHSLKYPHEQCIEYAAVYDDMAKYFANTAALSTVPKWRKIDPDNPPKQQDYFYLRRGENVTKEYMTSRMQWLGFYESGYKHYLTESDILSLPKE